MKTTMLVPEYYTKFHCIGPECELTCCKGWIVGVDRDEYDLLRATVTDPRLSAMLDEKVTRRRGAKRAQAYASMAMNSNGDCPFWEEGLCAIQKAYGGDILPLVCRGYPRVDVLLDECMERSLVLSCPEAARLCLLPAAPMEFRFEETQEKITKYRDLSYNRIGRVSRLCKAVRDFTIDLLQDRRFSLETRLLLLAVYIKKAREIDKKNLDQHVALIEDFARELATTQSVEKLFEGLTPDPTLHLAVTVAIFMADVKVGLPGYNEMKARMMAAMGIDLQNPNSERIAAIYRDAREKCDELYLRDHAHVLEHLLVNTAFRHVYPSAESDWWEGYMSLLCTYIIFRYHLIAHTAALGGMDDEKMIRCVTLVTRALLHNQTFMAAVSKVFTDNDWNSLAHVALVLRG